MRVNDAIVLGFVTLLMGCSDKPKSETAAVDTTSGISTTATADAQSAKREWRPAPQVFPPGARMAVVSGDPNQEGPFTVELAVPDGYKLAPHFHPSDDVVTVLAGTFLVGRGDKFDLKKTRALERGDSSTVEAGVHHFAIARGATIIRVSGQGPFAMTYVNPADDPTRRGAAQ